MYEKTPITQDERNFAGLIPLLGIFQLYILSIIIWIMKKDQSAFIDHHGKEYLNFTITMFIYGAIATLLIFVLIGILLWAVLGIYFLVVSISAAIRAFNGDLYRYPMILRFVK